MNVKIIIDVESFTDVELEDMAAKIRVEQYKREQKEEEQQEEEQKRRLSELKGKI